MSVDLLVFLALALVTVVTAAGMLLSRNAVYAALFLVLNFATVAMIYFLLGAPFIALAQVTVYAGAIMVLFLFVIMLLGAEELRPGPPQGRLRWQPALAMVLCIVLVGEAGFLVFGRGGVPAALHSVFAQGFGGPVEIGLTLFRDYALPFEVTSVLLLVAMIGAVVLSRDEKRQ